MFWEEQTIDVENAASSGRPGDTQGNLRSYDGNWDENVTLKLNFALS